MCSGDERIGLRHLKEARERTEKQWAQWLRLNKRPFGLFNYEALRMIGIQPVTADKPYRKQFLDALGF